MKLVTFGDSWVWGDELENNKDCYVDSYSEFKHKNNIGGVINSNYIFEEYLNLSINGGSNYHILYQLSNYLLSEYYDENDFIVIGLTSPMRQMIYSNLTKKYVGGWPNWNLEAYLDATNDESIKSKMFKDWWRYHVDMHINSHNDVLNYSQICLSIKGLLLNHNKYIIWQSIDSDFWKGYVLEDINKDPFQVQKLNKIEYDNRDPFDSENLNKILKSGTHDTQIWINIDEPSWISWLNSNFNHDDVFVRSSDHPNTFGVIMWFEKKIKKYLDKIIQK